LIISFSATLFPDLDGIVLGKILKVPIVRRKRDEFEDLYLGKNGRSVTKLLCFFAIVSRSLWTTRNEHEVLYIPADLLCKFVTLMIQCKQMVADKLWVTTEVLINMIEDKLCRVGAGATSAPVGIG
jgi:hypothetical protein